ncbi:EamA-like transporter family-domain-containing protein [Crassisporium funariophilum]|nr:EamA-like transporter family-domain-containing protein [Crassisporium funariophilum]
MSMSSSRNAYTALTPEYADFAIPHTPVSSSLNASSSRFPHPHPSANPEEYHYAIDEDDNEDEEEEEVGGGGGWARRVGRRVKEGLERNTGLLLVASSQAFLSMMNVAVKKLNGIDPPVSTLELVAVRMSITYICCMTYMLSMKVPDPFLGPKGVRTLLVIRGFVGFFGLFGVYYSLQYLSLSDATVLTFLAPTCTAIAGALLLGENFTRRQALAGLVSLVGVVLIARPTALFGAAAHAPDSLPITDVGIVLADNAEKGTPTERLIAVGVALIGVLGATGAYTSIRAIGKRAHPLHSMTFFSVNCVVVSTLGMIITKTPFIIPQRVEWMALLIMIGIFGFIAQTLLTMGLQRETAGRGSMAVYTQVVFATILERIFFHAVPTALSIIGTLLIISSAIYVALTKEKEDTPATAKPTHLHRLTRDAELEEGLLHATRGGSA